MSEALREFQKRMERDRLSGIRSKTLPKPPQFVKAEDYWATNELLKKELSEARDEITQLQIFAKNLSLPKMLAMPQQRQLRIPVPTDDGGLGTITQPTAGQVPIGQSDGTYRPSTLTLSNLSVVSKTFANSPYTALTTDDVILLNATGGAITVNLPAAATAGSGKTLRLKKTDASANAVTIDGNAAETIDGAATYLLSVQYQAVSIISDGSNWYAFA